MTAKEALEKSIEMWQYIKDNKCINKLSYFYDNNITKPCLTACYLCAYTAQFNSVGSTSCTNCPCKNWAKEGNETLCYDINSVYIPYECDIKTAYEIADDMLFVLKRALNELNNSNYKE